MKAHDDILRKKAAADRRAIGRLSRHLNFDEQMRIIFGRVISLEENCMQVMEFVHRLDRLVGAQQAAAAALQAQQAAALQARQAAAAQARQAAAADVKTRASSVAETRGSVVRFDSKRAVPRRGAGATTGQ